MNRATIEAAVRKNFPLPTPLPSQIDALVNILHELLVNNAKHVIVDGPTGSGKSAIAITLAETIKDLFDWEKSRWSYGSQYPYKTTILTSTKNLQRQYVQDFPVANVWGKTDYPCDHGTHYDTAECFVARQKGCDRSTDCTYFITRNMWLNSQVRITNLSFQIEACDMISNMPDNRASLMVIDECHTLGEKIQNHCSIRFSMEDLNRVEKWFDKSDLNRIRNAVDSLREIIRNEVDDDGVMRWPEAEKDFYQETSDFAGTVRESILSKRDKANIKDLRTIKGLSDAATYVGELADMLKVVHENTNKPMLLDGEDLKPIYPGSFAWYALYRKSNQFVHMSATICNVESYAEEVGIKDYVFIQMPNAIPAERREIVISSVQKVSKGPLNSDMMDVIDHIIKVHKKQSGIIHSVSYTRAKEIVAKSYHGARMFISNDRAEILEVLRRKPGSILVSPSVVEGFDFKDDLARFQIIPKVPYGAVDDPLQAMIFRMNKSLYFRRTILKVVQASGRTTRHVGDFSRTYILDSAFYELLRYNRDRFPEWYLEAITYIKKDEWRMLGKAGFDEFFALT